MSRIQSLLNSDTKMTARSKQACLLYKFIGHLLYKCLNVHYLTVVVVVGYDNGGTSVNPKCFALHL